MGIVPQHIIAKRGSLGKAALIAGDPERIKYIAKFLNGAKIVNKQRFLAYAGYYNGKKIGLVAHGIGMPSASIAIEETHALGVNTMVRLGTAGGLIKELRYGDVVLPTRAYYTPGGTLKEYFGNIKRPFAPNKELTTALANELHKLNIDFRQGSIFSSNAFYAEENLKGYIAVEMECAALFALAEYRKFRASAVLVISDNLVNKSMSKMLKSSEANKHMNIVTKAVLSALSKYA